LADTRRFAYATSSEGRQENRRIIIALTLAKSSLIAFGARDGMHETIDFVGGQLAIVIPIGPRELHFQKAEHLLLRDGFRRCDRSDVILNRHGETPRKYIIGSPVKTLLRNLRRRRGGGEVS
jgi:hypothetical protein